MPSREDPKLAARRMIPALDLTDLDEASNEAAIQRLCKKARTPFGPVAAICIWPRFLPLARELLAASNVKLAAVANFPTGEAPPADVAAEVAASVAAGADEIDLVFPWRAFRNGDRDAAAALLAALRPALRKPGGSRALLKVILETGQLGDAPVVRAAAAAAIAGGADFVKTSTGKTQPGASLPAASAMLDAILAARRERRWVGLKVSGGIRTVAEAAPFIALAEGKLGAEFINPGTFRIGASRLLDDALSVLGVG